jgi:hypothetical protein
VRWHWCSSTLFVWCLQWGVTGAECTRVDPQLLQALARPGCSTHIKQSVDDWECNGDAWGVQQ